MSDTRLVDMRELAARLGPRAPGEQHLWSTAAVYHIEDPEVALDNMTLGVENLVGFYPIFCLLCSRSYAYSAGKGTTCHAGEQGEALVAGWPRAGAIVPNQADQRAGGMTEPSETEPPVDELLGEVLTLADHIVEVGLVADTLQRHFRATGPGAESLWRAAAREVLKALDLRKRDGRVRQQTRAAVAAELLNLAEAYATQVGPRWGHTVSELQLGAQVLRDAAENVG